MELSDILFRVRLVLFVPDAVDPGTGILSLTPECLIQLLACDQVSNRVELPFRILLGELSEGRIVYLIATFASGESSCLLNFILQSEQ